MAESTAAKPVPVGFACVTPILRVGNVPASIEYYVHKLGFKLDWPFPEVAGVAPLFASVSRGGCHLFLCEGDQGHPGSWVWIGVQDAEALFQEYRSSGAKVRHPPTNNSWAYEMQAEDLDGNILRLGSEPKANEPPGEWLDMLGRRWTPDGKCLDAAESVS